MPQAIFNAVAPPNIFSTTTVQLTGGPIFSIRILTFTRTTTRPTSGTLKPSSTTGAIKAHDPADFSTLHAVVSAMNAGDTLPITINYTTNADGTLNVTSFSCGTILRVAKRLTLSAAAISASTEETSETATQIYERLADAQTAIVGELRELKGVLRQLVKKLPPRAARGGERGGRDRPPRSERQRVRRVASPGGKLAAGSRR